MINYMKFILFLFFVHSQVASSSFSSLCRLGKRGFSNISWCTKTLSKEVDLSKFHEIQLTGDRHHKFILQPQSGINLQIMCNHYGVEYRLPHLYCMEMKTAVDLPQDIFRSIFLDHAQDLSLFDKRTGKRGMWRKYFELLQKQSLDETSVFCSDIGCVSCLTDTIEVSSKVAKTIRSLYLKKEAEVNLTFERLENKIILPLIRGQDLEFDIINLAEDLGGYVINREGPKDGLNVTVTWIGPTFLIQDPDNPEDKADKLRFRVRAYGDDDGQISLQRDDKKVWFEAKIFLAENSKEHKWGAVNKKIRVLVQLDSLNEMIRLSLDSYSSLSDSEAISAAINNVFGEALDDPENNYLDVIKLGKMVKTIYYKYGFVPSFDAAIFVTRSSRVLCLPK
jgi:hypothetical protein